MPTSRDSLSQAPAADYAQRGDGKYLNDNGGPSLWWRDETMRRIRETFAAVNLDSHAFDELDELLQDEPDEGVLARLEDYPASQGSRTYGNAEETVARLFQVGEMGPTAGLVDTKHCA